MRVISDQKWPLKKRPVIAHIKARSKHSFLTINRNDLLHTKQKKKRFPLLGLWGAVGTRKFYMGTQNGSNYEL